MRCEKKDEKPTQTASQKTVFWPSALRASLASMKQTKWWAWAKHLFAESEQKYQTRSWKWGRPAMNICAERQSKLWRPFDGDVRCNDSIFWVLRLLCYPLRSCQTLTLQTPKGGEMYFKHLVHKILMAWIRIALEKSRWCYQLIYLQISGNAYWKYASIVKIKLRVRLTNIRLWSVDIW